MNYVRNPGNTCVGTSLANFFIYMEDIQTAQKVAQEYRQSLLVRNNGDIHIGLVTRLVKELTDNQYVAKLNINWDIDPVEAIKRNYKEGFDTPDVDYLLSIFHEETRLKNILGYKSNSLSVAFPNIMFLNNSHKDSHAVVALDPKGPYINDGDFVNTKELIQAKLNPCPNALLEIFPKDANLYRIH